MFAETRCLRLVRCGSCDLVYTNPQPAARVLEKYRLEYDLAAYFSQWSDRKRLLFKRRLRDLYPGGAGRRRLCDVGCADGQFLELAAELGWEPHGVELNPPAARHARQRGAVVHEGLLEERDDLAWRSFDLVTAWDVLEHTPTPSEFARRLVRLAKPGGIVAVTTLNRDSLACKVLGARWSMVVEDHFTYWNMRSLTALFEAVGCQPLVSSSSGLGRDFFAWADRLQPGRGATSVAAESPSDGRFPRRWDTAPGVLAAERTLNRLLNRQCLGVEIAMTFRVGCHGS